MKCEICGVHDTEKVVRKIKGKYLCSKHITQMYRYGKFSEESIYTPNQIIRYKDYAEIVLKDRHLNEVGRAIIDIDDIPLCERYKWHIKRSRKTSYAVAKDSTGKTIFLHRLVLNYNGPDDVDHKDLNGLNNRKRNLKICSHSENLINQGQDRRGIYMVKSGRYRATITKDYHTHYLGTFDTKEEALEARIKAEKSLFFGQ